MFVHFENKGLSSFFRAGINTYSKAPESEVCVVTVLKFSKIILGHVQQKSLRPY